MKQIEVQIMQQSYLLSCPEGRELHLLEAVERIERGAALELQRTGAAISHGNHLCAAAG